MCIYIYIATSVYYMRSGGEHTNIQAPHVAYHTYIHTYIYIYIYIFVCMLLYIYMHIYIYILIYWLVTILLSTHASCLCHIKIRKALRHCYRRPRELVQQIWCHGHREWFDQIIQECAREVPLPTVPAQIHSAN